MITTTNPSPLDQMVSELPADIQRPIREIALWLREDLRVSHKDFSELNAAVERLAEAQEKLAEAQVRTEQKVEQLAEAQARTEQKVEQLAEAQGRTEREIGKLRKTLSDQITGLGSRWGIYNEGTFRSTIYGIFSRMDGVTVKEGWYGGRQVDVVIRNGEHILLEITSRMHSRDIDKLYRSADDYETQTGVRPTLMVATSYVSPRLMQTIMNLERPIDIFSYEGEE